MRPGFAWSEDLARLLGKISDQKLGKLAGIHPRTVAAERKRRGILAYRPRRPRVKWTEDMIALLGTASDQQVAAELGLSVQSVFRKRRELGISPAHPQPNQPPRGHPWTPDELALLGRMTDAEVAEEIGISGSTVARTRRILGIPPFAPRAPWVDWTPEMIALLGTETDTQVAERLGISMATVQRKRHDLGIPARFDSGAVVRTPELEELLRRPTTEVQRRTKLDGKTIARLRLQCGIEPPPPLPSRWTPELDARLGQEPDRVLAAELGITPEAVRARRKRLGIRAWRWTRR